MKIESFLLALPQNGLSSQAYVETNAPDLFAQVLRRSMDGQTELEEEFGNLRSKVLVLQQNTLNHLNVLRQLLPLLLIDVF